MPQCSKHQFYKLYKSLEVQHQKLSNTQTFLRHWLKAWLQDSTMLVSVPVRSINCRISLAVWWISTTKRGLGNIFVLLFSENIAATHNKHAWETGKPKNVEISAHLGTRKVALKSICATFSPVTPFFNFFWNFFKSRCQVQLENAIYSKFYLTNFEYHEFFYRFTNNWDCDFEHTLEVRRLFGGGRVVDNGQ